MIGTVYCTYGSSRDGKSRREVLRERIGKQRRSEKRGKGRRRGKTRRDCTKRGRIEDNPRDTVEIQQDPLAT